MYFTCPASIVESGKERGGWKWVVGQPMAFATFLHLGSGLHVSYLSLLVTTSLCFCSVLWDISLTLSSRPQIQFSALICSELLYLKDILFSLQESLHFSNYIFFTVFITFFSLFTISFCLSCWFYFECWARASSLMMWSDDDAFRQVWLFFTRSYAFPLCPQAVDVSARPTL